MRGPFSVLVVTHHVRESDGFVGCGSSWSAPTLQDAVREAVSELERVPYWDGRAPKSLLITDSNGKPVFSAERSGNWTDAVSERVLKRARLLVRAA